MIFFVRWHYESATVSSCGGQLSHFFKGQALLRRPMVWMNDDCNVWSGIAALTNDMNAMIWMTSVLMMVGRCCADQRRRRRRHRRRCCLRRRQRRRRRMQQKNVCVGHGSCWAMVWQDVPWCSMMGHDVSCYAMVCHDGSCWAML